MLNILLNIFALNSMKQFVHLNFQHLSNITPVFKQDSRNQKKNDRPISILPIISKIFEKYFHNFQITLIMFFQNFNVVLEKAI